VRDSSELFDYVETLADDRARGVVDDLLSTLIRLSRRAPSWTETSSSARCACFWSPGTKPQRTRSPRGSRPCWITPSSSPRSATHRRRGALRVIAAVHRPRGGRAGGDRRAGGRGGTEELSPSGAVSLHLELINCRSGKLFVLVEMLKHRSFGPRRISKLELLHEFAMNLHSTIAFVVADLGTVEG
jgi:hypothetical protein